MRTPVSIPVLPLALVAALTLFILPAAAVQPVEECAICDVDLSRYAGPLTQSEVQGLLRALDNEYRAWVGYGRVIEDFGAVRPFAKIQLVEAHHIAAIQNLLRKYKVPVPANPWAGKAPRYDSVEEALAASTKEEIASHRLYRDLTTTTPRRDILRVYRGLERAEKDHLALLERERAAQRRT